nr:unnamed protein product [Callosobruchus analis]
MGLLRAPKLADYWSKNKLYVIQIASIMSCNRFELMLVNWHFQDNQNADTSNGLYKLGPLLDQLRTNFQKYFIPKVQICVDETFVPFRGRLAFMQHIKNKRHKFGVKLYKLSKDVKIYCEREKPLLNCARCIYVDNYYTSVELAHKHILEDVGACNRRRCCTCYLKISKEKVRTVAAKKRCAV